MQEATTLPQKIRYPGEMEESNWGGIDLVPLIIP